MGLGGGYSEGSGETMSEMTGLERLRALGREQEERSWSTVGKVRGRLMLQIAEQIEDERLREQLAVERVVSEMELHCLGVEGMDDSPVARWARELREALGGHVEEVTDVATIRKDAYDAYEWMCEHGGLDYVMHEWQSRVPRDRYERRRQRLLDHIAECETALGRRNERIEELGRRVGDLATENAELRRRTMPEGVEWPRYEDGEPVLIGGEFMGKDGKTYTAKQIQFIGKCFSLYDFCDRKPQFNAFYGERVKRPAPKVLDVDGAEIREKCDVWWICEGDERGVHAERLRVETICPNGLIERSPYNGGTWVSLEPSELYVNKPVPAADGEPLEVGQTVWDVDGHGPLVVRVLPSEGEQLVVLDNGGTNFYRYPEKLTHEPPDSWERLEEDCAKSDVDYCAERGLLDPSCDTVEGEGSTRHCTDCECTCGEKMARDLVRRARALAGRDAS